jgi:hypothetical protein
MQFDLASVDLRDIEDIVDERKQEGIRGLDFPQVILQFSLLSMSSRQRRSCS